MNDFRLPHEETVDLLAAADKGPLELVAYVEELVAAQRDDVLVQADLGRTPIEGLG